MRRSWLAVLCNPIMGPPSPTEHLRGWPPRNANRQVAMRPIWYEKSVREWETKEGRARGKQEH